MGLNLVNLTKDLTNVPYKLGGQTTQDGMDCFSVVYQFLKRKGADLPEEYKGLTLESYADAWAKDRVKTQETMIQFCEDHLTEIPIHKAFAGDVLLLSCEKDKSSHAFLAVDAGNGNVIIAGEKFGVKCLAVKNRFKVERAFR